MGLTAPCAPSTLLPTAYCLLPTAYCLLPTASAGQIRHHRIKDQHADGRAAQAGIAEPLDEAVLDQEILARRVEVAAGERLPAGKVHAFPQPEAHQQQLVGLLLAL